MLRTAVIFLFLFLLSGCAGEQRRPQIVDLTRPSPTLFAPQPRTVVAGNKPSPITRRVYVAQKSATLPAKSSRYRRNFSKWQWPANGPVINKFNNALKNNGIDIAGADGAAVSAAESGKVVYSGSGLRGLGRLIIIKHDNNFLSAYAHNKNLLVKEGDLVKVGQRIADMGHSGDKKAILHFEIRRNGQPVDPLLYLQKR